MPSTVLFSLFLHFRYSLAFNLELTNEHTVTWRHFRYCHVIYEVQCNDISLVIISKFKCEEVDKQLEKHCVHIIMERHFTVTGEHNIVKDMRLC